MPNFITRAPLTRRSLLKGAGVAIAVPFLDAMLPRAAFARGIFSAPSPLRFVFVMAPNGMHMPAWTPALEGDDYSLSPSLAPLKDRRSDLLVISGLRHANADPRYEGAGDHARAAAVFLTGTRPRKTEGTNIQAGVSFDQMLASRIGGDTLLPSLELGCELPYIARKCDPGYACAYHCNIAWRSPTTPQLKEIDPRRVFERLFASADGLDAKERARRLARRKSVLDYASGDAGRLRDSLGTTDRRKLDEYLSSVREIERQIEKAEVVAARPDSGKAPPIAKPNGIPRDHADHARLLFDLIALAFEADSTRIVTLMLANEGTSLRYPAVPMPDGHHELSHHGGDPEKQATLAQINHYHVELFGHFLSRLAAKRDGERRLLDQSVVLYGSAIADGNSHAHDDLPFLVAGRGGGAIKTGRHLRVQAGTPVCNLLLNFADLAQIDLPTFGDGTGRIAALGT